MKSGKKKQRSTEHQIYLYEIQHEGGVFYHYVNESKDHEIEEEITFELEGIEVVGYPTDKDGNCKVLVKLKPGENKSLNLKRRIGQAMSLGSSTSTSINPVEG
jgi:hypothetical protein